MTTAPTSDKEGVSDVALCRRPICGSDALRAEALLSAVDKLAYGWLASRENRGGLWIGQVKHLSKQKGGGLGARELAKHDQERTGRVLELL